MVAHYFQPTNKYNISFADIIIENIHNYCNLTLLSVVKVLNDRNKLKKK